MSKPKNKLLRRQAAVQKALDRFNGRDFDIGEVDCGQLILFHLRSLGVKIPKNKLKKYKTLSQARAAIREAFGVTTLQEVCDLFLDRITPAAAIVGDIIELPAADDAEYGIGALSIYLGNGAALMFEETQPHMVAARILYNDEGEPLAAWRAIK